MSKLILLFCLCFSLVFCNNDKNIYSKLDYNYSQIVGKNPDIIEATIKLDIEKIEKEVLLEIPGNIYFSSYVNGNLLFENNKGKIFNLSDSINSSDIKIYSYTNVLHFIIKKENLQNGTINFRIEKNEHVSDYKSSIKFFVKSKSTNKNDSQPDFSIKENKLFNQSNLPIFKINTNESIISDTNIIVADYFLINNKDINKLNDLPKKTGKVKIKIRGSSSKLLPKQSYFIKTLNDSLKKQNVKLIGLPKESEWVLYSTSVDPSLMRNVLSYKLHRQMGNYSPRTRYCHLIINNDYRGIYVLTESIKIDEKRVNISELNKADSDISGGYIIKLDKGNGKAWRSPYNAQVDTGFGKWFIYVYPDEENLTDAQAKYIRNYFSDFEKAIVENKDWKNYIEVKSFIDYQILMELSKNVDAYRLSMYFSKNKGGKLKIEPIWDMDLTFGLTSYFDGYKVDGLMYKDKATPFWWNYFLKDNDYKTQLSERWKELRTTILSENKIYELVDSNYQVLSNDVDYNTFKWNNFKEKSMWRKYDYKDYKESVDYLKSWIKQRLEYLDKELIPR